MTKREQITTLLREAAAPGITAGDIAQQMETTVGSVMGHIKKIRLAWELEATACEYDLRSRHYHITARKVGSGPHIPRAAHTSRARPTSQQSQSPHP